MFGYPTQLKFIIAPTLLITLMVILEIMKPNSVELLGFIPEHLANGEIWRAITGQLLHTNLNHLMLNVLGLVLVWALHGEYYSAKHYSAVLTTSLALIGVGLAFTYSNTHYSGLSGVLHALLVYGAILDVSKSVKTGWLILIGIGLKVAYEMTFGAANSTAQLIAANVAVEAHLIGAFTGLIMGAVYLLIKTKKAL